MHSYDVFYNHTIVRIYFYPFEILFPVTVLFVQNMESNLRRATCWFLPLSGLTIVFFRST